MALRALATLPLLVTLPVLAACSGTDELADATCPQGGTTLTYDSFGKGFMDAHCQSCHGSAATERRGAPDTYVFDTHAQVQRWKARIYARAAGENDSMPPGPDDPPRAERDSLAEWLACGAP